jgi:uncharacterized protein (DUF1778 family)
MSERTDRDRRAPDQKAAVNLRLSPEERDALHRVAESRGVSTSTLLRETVRGMLTEAGAR